MIEKLRIWLRSVTVRRRRVHAVGDSEGYLEARDSIVFWGAVAGKQAQGSAEASTESGPAQWEGRRLVLV